ncbi:MAG: ankyrin repeat domain-containing protein [Spirochaetaceae bacterium]|jgi:ankyrin repeat protein|nr:ankyrin repeat domain-containing protein [Spirochaetaceae bacterium]
MIKRPVLCAVLYAVVLLQTQRIYAEDYKWDFVNALINNDVKRIETILQDNISKMSFNEKRMLMGFALEYTAKENTLAILKLLTKYNIHATGLDLYNAISKLHTDDVVLFILADGVKPDGEHLLLAAEKNRSSLIKTLTENGVDVNYRYPAGKPYSNGMTALLYAAKWNNFDAVKFLAEHGANINARSDDGYTASSFAYENGQTQMFNYLKEKGAKDFESYNNYNNYNVPANTTQSGSGMAKLLGGGATGLKNGTYSLSGGNTKIKFQGNGQYGQIVYSVQQGKTGTGAFNIEGGKLTITMEGLTFVYQINSGTSFSGNGETWILSE